jgi:hypothetical protein
MSEVRIVNGGITDGELRMSLLGNEGRISAEFINKLKEEFVTSVNELAAFCDGTNNAAQTVSDLIDNDIDDSELDMLNALFD